MSAARAPVIPIMAAAPGAGDPCGAAEPFALRVLGEAMAPEFAEGDIVVVEPDGLATDGAYVIARAHGEWFLRRLVAHGGGWRLRALDPRFPDLDIPGLEAVRGVVIQRARPGRRRESRRYGPG